MTLPFRIRMTGRATDEKHRVSSPLELLFDLTFVVAIAQVAAELATAGEEGHALDKLGPYCMVFFAIWWAWMNFTWFASAYDTDDVPYRLMTMLQMGGVLVLAAGVPAAFEEQSFTAVIVGYLIMRLALVAQWIRAAVEHPEGRVTALRYAGGVAAVQVLWVAWGFMPPAIAPWLFPVGALLELAVPLWAERTGMTSWHPHHIAERYGLFTIIVLGESVLASSVGVQRALAANGLSASLIAIAAAGLVLLFALWWLYFLEPAAEGLSSRRGRSFYWGYGHYFVFASLAALGAGLEVAVQRGADHAEVSDTAVEYAVAIPVAVFLLMLYVLHAPLVQEVVIRPLKTTVAIVLILLLPLASPAIGLVGVTIGIAVVAAGLVAATLVDRAVAAREAAARA
ncbi:low temperature requirement protein A [Leifsonia sp. F6_8S_P_1B]|uniref:Low temperature requirement protein A n=1 Tax=Leifsonia williamsii TaxID=3035919 RepID=A0ABT8KBH0_9MICO|nr:low temperature requirement protein A [Leifsonia williamsii]MDN4614805.1 low temperature requirement protein A [Leifsonia williamsii]